MGDEICSLCRRNKILSIIFIQDYDFNRVRFEEDLCDLCNSYNSLIGVRKAPTDFDIKRLNFVIFMSKRISDYYDDERRIQQSDSIQIWKNTKYLQQWYNIKYGKDTRFKKFKIVIETLFDNKADLTNGMELNLKCKGKKLVIDWLVKNYFTLKLQTKWN